MFRWRDPQLQVSENYADLAKLILKTWWLMSLFLFNMFKSWYIIKGLIDNYMQVKVVSVHSIYYKAHLSEYLKKRSFFLIK